MKQETIKRNTIFILLIGIEGLAFGLLDWDSVISDLVYLKYNNKLLISIITANISLAKILATLVCIYINDSNKPNKIFEKCIILSSIGSLLIGLIYHLNFLILFAIIYILEVLILEIFSAYHYAYAYNSLPDNKATQVHSKRIAIFKFTYMAGIAIASYLTTKYIDNTMLAISIFATIIFLIVIVFVKNVKNEPKNKEKELVSLKEKLNLSKYTKYYRSWIVIRFFGKFALSSLVVLLSMLAIDMKLDLAVLKFVKTTTWIFSAVGFWLSAYLIKNKVIVKYDILCKVMIILLIIITFIWPYAIFIILLLKGLLEPFNTMSNFTMIQMDNDNINAAQKELIINLFGFLAGMLSSYILLNININLAFVLIIFTLTVSSIGEIKLYRLQKNE